MGPTCGTCNYFIEDPAVTAAAGQLGGECRRYPPTVTMLDAKPPNEAQRVILAAAQKQPLDHRKLISYPAVVADVSWCGEHFEIKEAEHLKLMGKASEAAVMQHLARFAPGNPGNANQAGRSAATGDAEKNYTLSQMELEAEQPGAVSIEDFQRGLPSRGGPMFASFTGRPVSESDLHPEMQKVIAAARGQAATEKAPARGRIMRFVDWLLGTA